MIPYDMEQVSGLQWSYPPVHTGHPTVSTVSTPAHIHHDHNIPVMTHHEALPVNNPSLIHQLSPRLTRSRKYFLKARDN